MLEYWHNAEATKEKFHGDWLLTGDLGMQDADGYVWFLSRKDDVINSAGYRIGPGEIEASLGQPRGGRDGRRSSVCPTSGAARYPKAFVVLRPGREPSDELADELRAARPHAARRRTRCRARSCSSTTCRRPRPARSCDEHYGAPDPSCAEGTPSESSGRREVARPRRSW